MTTTACAPCTQPATRPTQMGLFHRLTQIGAVTRQRRALCNLTPEQHADIGITAAQARQEADRPVWDVPAHWTS